MNTNLFPINYFKSIWTPITAFLRRQQLSWPKLILVLLFLNALMTIPVTLNFAQRDTYPIENFYPNILNVLEEQPLTELKKADYHKGEMIVAAPFIFNNDYGTVAGGVHQEEALMNEENILLFNQHEFIIKEEGAPTAKIPYTEDFSLKHIQNQKEALNALSRQWFVQNQAFVVAFFTFMISSFLLVMTLLIILGASFFLYLTKNSHLTSITTYKETVNLVVNLLSLPTILATLFGVIHFDIVWMVTIQTLGLLIMLVIVYAKTQFNDEKLKSK